MNGDIKIPASKGKFRRDLYEKAVRAIGNFSTEKSPYRAFGESRSSSRDKVVDSKRQKQVTRISK